MSRNNGGGTGDVGRVDEADVAAALARRHLPMLAEIGFIEWDPETETVRRGPNFEEFGALLAEADGSVDVPSIPPDFEGDTDRR
ncbi:hypothetical protein [Halorussus sp. AFM4]|uniref:hypothetical protein n=1 Tax=Halorussus sp. AFM4 TaxID=3421651 RepID=UPI003EB88B80